MIHLDGVTFQMCSIKHETGTAVTFGYIDLGPNEYKNARLLLGLRSSRQKDCSASTRETSRISPTASTLNMAVKSSRSVDDKKSEYLFPGMHRIYRVSWQDVLTVEGIGFGVDMSRSQG